jgi:hypothetical protein
MNSGGCGVRNEGKSFQIHVFPYMIFLYIIVRKYRALIAHFARKFIDQLLVFEYAFLSCV